MDNLFEKKMTPAIVLASHTIGLGLIRVLGIMGVPVVVVYYNKNDMGYVSRYVDKCIFAPHPEKHESDFVDILVGMAGAYSGSILIPSDDATIYNVSKNKEKLKKYYIVACTEWDVTQRFLNKRHTYELAESIGVPAPKTRLLKTLEDIEKYRSDFEFPCIIKPCYGHRYFEFFNRKMVRVDNREQLLAELKQCLEYELEVMLQELIPGDDTHGVNYNSYRTADGDILAEFTAEKIRLSPPNFGVPRVIISKEIPEIIEPGRAFLHALGFYGYSCTEFKRDERDGVYKLMEVNGRVNLSLLHAWKCGINFPEIMYNHLLFGELHREQDFEKNIYWIDISKDIITSVIYIKKERYSLSQYFTPYLKKNVYAIFDIKDLKPFIKRWYDFIKAGVKKYFTKRGK